MTTNLISINVPYAKRHILPELRINGGKFDSDTKTWILPDSPEARTLKEIAERRVAVPAPTERITNIAKLTIDLLNSLKYREFKIVEVGNRIVLESTPLIIKSASPAVEGTPLVAAATPPVAVGAPPVTASLPSGVDSTMLVS
jgi:hypothetical protein